MSCDSQYTGPAHKEVWTGHQHCWGLEPVSPGPPLSWTRISFVVKSIIHPWVQLSLTWYSNFCLIIFPVKMLWDSSDCCSRCPGLAGVGLTTARLMWCRWLVILWSPLWWQSGKSQLTCDVQLPNFPADGAIRGTWWTFCPPRLCRVFCWTHTLRFKWPTQWRGDFWSAERTQDHSYPGMVFSSLLKFSWT